MHIYVHAGLAIPHQTHRALSQEAVFLRATAEFGINNRGVYDFIAVQ